MTIVVFGKEDCKWCQKTRKKLISLELTYYYVNIDEYTDEEKQQLKEKTGMDTVPIIIMKDKDFIGGYYELLAFMEENIIIEVPVGAMGAKAQ